MYTSYAYSILDGRKEDRQESSKVKDRRVSVTTAVIAAIVSLIGGGTGVFFLTQYFGDPNDELPAVEESASE